MSVNTARTATGAVLTQPNYVQLVGVWCQQHHSCILIPLCTLNRYKGSSARLTDRVVADSVQP
eukprot:1354466-Prymnesium_polylepis.1